MNRFIMTVSRCAGVFKFCRWFHCSGVFCGSAKSSILRVLSSERTTCACATAIQYVVKHGVVVHAIFSLGLYLALLGISVSWLYLPIAPAIQVLF